jgi:hypothetical protein
LTTKGIPHSPNLLIVIDDATDNPWTAGACLLVGIEEVLKPKPKLKLVIHLFLIKTPPTERFLELSVCQIQNLGTLTGCSITFAAWVA